jgi:hypothetical protein
VVAAAARPVPVVTFEEAYPLVVADRRAGCPGLSTVEALVQAYDVVGLGDVRGDDEVATAYRTVLYHLDVRPTREELLDVLRLLAGEGVVDLSVLQEFWVYRALRGDAV